MESVFSDVKHHVSWLDLLKSIYIFNTCLHWTPGNFDSKPGHGLNWNHATAGAEPRGKGGIWLVDVGGNQQKKEWGNSEKQHYRNMGKKYRFYRSHNSWDFILGKRMFFCGALLVLCDPTYCGKCLEQAASAEGTRGVWQRTRCKKHIVEISPLFILGQAWMGRS